MCTHAYNSEEITNIFYYFLRFSFLAGWNKMIDFPCIWLGWIIQLGWTQTNVYLAQYEYFQLLLLLLFSLTIFFIRLWQLLFLYFVLACLSLYHHFHRYFKHSPHFFSLLFSFILGQSCFFFCCWKHSIFYYSFVHS